MTIEKFNLPSSFEKALADWQQGKILLRLFVAGNTQQTQSLIAKLHALCETNLAGDYQLEVIDITQQPALARQQQIIATPTLVKYLPEPKKMLVGNFFQGERLMAFLGLAV